MNRTGQRLNRRGWARTVAASLAALLAVCASARAQEGRAAQGQAATYSNPVIEGDYPDPSVIRVGGEFWAATTSGGWAPHFPLLRSRDLVNWEVVGAVFREKPAWARGDFWAPELVADAGRFFVYYTARRDEGPKRRGTLCVAVATADSPAGPYTDRGPLACEIKERGGVGSIDPDFVRDETGAPYLVWKADGNDAEPDEPTSIFAQPLSADGTKLLGKRKEILRNTAPWEQHVTEGSYLLRRGDWFYHFYSGNACCGRSCRYALGVARSRKLLGPWEKNPANPILAANERWQCPGHGSIVQTEDGRSFLLYHSYRQSADTFNVGREALLDEVKWGDDGWPNINAGRGPSSVAPAPLGVAERPPQSEFFDGFNSEQLNAAWQWPMHNRQSVSVEARPGGHLVLTCTRPDVRADDAVCAVLARPTASGSYVVTAAVDARQSAGTTQAGGAAPATQATQPTQTAQAAQAGLAAYGWADAALGITVGGGRVSVWRREDRNQQTVASAPAPNAPNVFLRMSAADGQQYRFAYSANGRDWTELGGAVEGSYIEGVRVALTAGGAPGAAARFDWVKIQRK